MDCACMDVEAVALTYIHNVLTNYEPDMEPFCCSHVHVSVRDIFLILYNTSVLQIGLECQSSKLNKSEVLLAVEQLPIRVVIQAL